ncbi:MAG: hypothetical protein US76_00305 [Parcubacteria group bacterium GW2011_GWA2_38_13b]|nr:MAG: hypothetical protein US76_00305 [Parcubacteria group bacterium GW2011_GWA2_38_13b]
MLIKTQEPIIKHITDFLEYCEVEKGLSPVTVKNYAQFLSKFTGWLKDHSLDHLTPQDLTEEHIWQYRLYLSRFVSLATHRGLSKDTQNYYFIALRALLGYFIDKNIKSLPPNKIKLPKVSKSKKIKFLSLEQLQKLLNAPDISNPQGLRDRAILETLFSTGLRVAELVSLNINQLNLKDAEKNTGLEVAITGKGNATRVVFFSRRCCEWITKYLKYRNNNDASLFAAVGKNKKNPESLRLSTRSIERIVQKYARETGLPLLATPHTLRHTYATDLLNQGVDLRMIQEFLGHKNIAATQIYTHVTNKNLRDIHRKFHSGNKLE